MKTIAFIILFSSFFVFSFASAGDTTKNDMPPVIKEENVVYSGDSTTMHGFVAYQAASKVKQPIVIIVHEWWGINDYIKNRARQLAEMGYVAFAVDLYGEGKQGNTPAEAGKLASPFYRNHAMTQRRFEAALSKAKNYGMADANKIAAIGYCFGGAMVLNMARLGEPLKGVVSFHGSLLGAPADKNKLMADILVCHGAADKFVTDKEIAQFKKEMDSIGAMYTFKAYPDATHAFSNPNATKIGEQFKIPIAYNAEADKKSWQDMQDFFHKIFK